MKISTVLKLLLVAALSVFTLGVSQAHADNGTDHPTCEGRVEISVNAPTWTVPDEYDGWQVWSKAGDNPHTNHGYLPAGTTINSGIPDGSGEGFKEISHVDLCPPPPTTTTTAAPTTTTTVAPTTTTTVAPTTTVGATTTTVPGGTTTVAPTTTLGPTTTVGPTTTLSGTTTTLPSLVVTTTLKPPAPSPTPPNALPVTGWEDSENIAAIAAGVIAAGVLAMLVSRRRTA